MLDQIPEQLERIAKEANIQILFACESGSRAWGFPSPDSDYDVRFIYAHSVDWHLRLQKQRDTFEAMLPGDLDMAGWELRKALKLFAGCNLALFEWLNSPIIYLADNAFHRDLLMRLPAYFNPKKALFHYLNMASHGLKHLDENGHIGIKKLFYVLRPLMACSWIQHFANMPPTDIKQMLAKDGFLTDDLKESIESLIHKKSSLDESHREKLPENLHSWITDIQEVAESLTQTIVVPPTPGLISLNPLMVDYTPTSNPKA